jgi:hypothetical protein
MGFPRLFLIRTEAPILGVTAVRPADENQYSTRPNLMSSGRRGGSDQSILEMLERDTGRSGRSRRGRSRLAWYGAGGTLAVGLIGLLAWLTHDSAPPQEAQPIVVAEAAASAGRPARLDPAAELLGLNELDEPPRQHHAAVIDEQLARQTKPITPVAMLTPPGGSPLPTPGAGKGALVQDEPSLRAGGNADAVAGGSKGAAAGASKAAMTSASKATTSSASTAAATGKSTAAARGASTAAAASARSQTSLASRNAAKPQTARTAPDQARARPSAKPAPSTTTRNVQHKLAHNAPRARKAAALAQPSRPVVDSDVALISAVIQHSSARTEGPCLEPNCAAKTTAQP